MIVGDALRLRTSCLLSLLQPSLATATALRATSFIIYFYYQNIILLANTNYIVQIAIISIQQKINNRKKSMKKKVDSRIQTLLQNNIKKHQRSMVFLVGDRSRYQVVNFHYMLTKQYLKQKPSVLWCYSKDLQFSTHQKKRIKETKSKQIKGLYDQNVDDPFQLFISSTNIRYAFYDETHKILGNTYQMLVLQDFQALTPNILCRTIETVEGGGLIVFLIKSLTSLKQLYTLAMDAHQRYRTQAHTDIEPRFNQRFILSLSECRSSIFMDDELNILPISSHIEQIHPLQSPSQIINTKAQKQLSTLKKDLSQKQVIGTLLQTAKTLDQAKVIMSLVEVLMDKNNKTTVSLSAARGRGKSAAIGLGIAAAIKIGFSNVFVTAPSPNNLKTLFQFVGKGLELLGYKERLDFQKIISNNKEYEGAVMRIQLFKTHTQFIQYVFPTDSDKIGHTDLVIIDEAAAIPLPYVKSFFGPHSLFLSSTINGYEGTGRSLSLKLLQQIKQQNRRVGQGNATFHKLKQITMNDPIRYAMDDQIQKWLNGLLLLNATQSPPLKHGIPHPNDCELYIVNRDALFSYKKSCEKFLFNLMSLFIASHYKNSPNDLQLLSDSPSHLVFVLAGPLRKNQEGKTQMPDILCALQVALEGTLSDNSIKHNSQRGLKPSGDLIPWNIREQFQDSDFPKLSGARVVRIATHSMVQKMGYGSKALSLLIDFFERKMITNTTTELAPYNFKGEGVSKPLLRRLDEVQPPQLHYVGTSFGFTTNLVKFWRKNGFEPVYLRQTVNDITSEHSGIMLRALQNQSKKVNTSQYVKDFSKRFMNLLSYQFRKLSPGLALQILQYTNRKKQKAEQAQKQGIKLMPKQQFELFISLFDLNRLKSYANNQADYHLVIDLVPTLTKLYFSGAFGIQNFNYTWEAILVGVGLQHKSIQEVTKEIGQGDKYNVSNSLALFHKAMIRFYKISKQIFESVAQQRIPQQQKLNVTAYKNNKQLQEQMANQQIKRINEPEKKVRHARIQYGLDDSDIQDIEEGINSNRNTVTIKRNLQKARHQDLGHHKKKRVKKQ